MVSGRELSANLKQAQQLIEQAANAGVVMAVLPETFALFNASGQRDLAVAEAGPTPPVREFLRQQARRHRLWLVAGTLPLPTDDGRARAACLVYNDNGEEVARYDKIHLFDVDVADGHRRYRESETYQPGEKPVLVETPWGKLGLAVCYDLRFPELFRQLRAEGADLFAVPSAFTRHTGLAHWLPLMRARAIENQCLVIGANQGGWHTEKRATSGGSVIVDYWGRVLAEAGFGPQCVWADFDREAQLTGRQQMPCEQHRRLG